MSLPLAVLAGGLATRLRPATELTPKILLDVAGRPFAEHQVELFKRNGIVRVVYCLGYLGEQGQEHLGFAPLFGHQYSHVWIDFRGLQDAFMREKGIDYFENSRRATLAQRAYAIENPGRFRGYGPELWGLSA